VWCTISSGLSKIQNLVADTDYSSEFKQFSLDLMSEIVKKVGWEKVTDEPHVQGLLRSMILAKTGMLGHEDTLAEARLVDSIFFLVSFIEMTSFLKFRFDHKKERLLESRLLNTKNCDCSNLKQLLSVSAIQLSKK
jgi:hypothetical protein